MKKRISSGQSILKLLFKEVLELMPPEEAGRLAVGYNQGQNIFLVLGQSSHGRVAKTAFGYALTDSQDWRGLPDAGDSIN